MRLMVTTPLRVVVDADHVTHVRAEDETGAFGILPGHANLVTVLTVSVISWLNHDGEEHHIAVRGGVLTVRDGSLVEVATRDAVGEDTLRALGDAVLARFRADALAETESRVSSTRLHLATMRQMQRYLEAGRNPVPQGHPAMGRAPTARLGAHDEGLPS